MLNFAILSAGNIAGRMARTLDSLRDEVQPYAIAARDSARAQALAGRYGFAYAQMNWPGVIFRPLKQRIPADLYIVYETQQVTPAMVKLLAALTQ